MAYVPVPGVGAPIAVKVHGKAALGYRGGRVS